MPKVPQPAKPPESISPLLWQSENRDAILEFLAEINGTFLFYQVMPNDPDEQESEIDRANAEKVDKILKLQKAQFLAQADDLQMHPKKNTPTKKIQMQDAKEELLSDELDGGDFEDADVKFHKLPAGVYGLKDLQKGLFTLLKSMGKANYSTTIGGVSPTSPTCGTDLLKSINNEITPKSSVTDTQAKIKYTAHKESFTDSTNFVTWWTTLLLLQTVKRNLGIKDSSRKDALEDACSTMEEKTGPSSRWSMEIMTWRMRAATEKTAKTGCRTDEEEVTSFAHHMRLHQQKIDAHKTVKANAANVTDYCTWCFKHKGKKFNNHTEATCNNKARANGGGERANGGSERRKCFVCHSQEHFAKDCPLLEKVRALKVDVTEPGTCNVAAENKNSASVPPVYSMTPTSPTQTQHRRAPASSALVTTALLASAAAPTLAHFDSAATANMGPDVRFLKDPKPSSIGIEVYNNEVVTNNIEGVFMSHSVDGNLPDAQRGYVNPNLPTTLISGPQVVFEHPKQDVVLSERHGSFMQPSSENCPICNKHDNRINFKGGPAGFTLEIFPGHKPTEHALYTDTDMADGGATTTSATSAGTTSDVPRALLAKDDEGSMRTIFEGQPTTSEDTPIQVPDVLPLANMDNNGDALDHGVPAQGQETALDPTDTSYENQFFRQVMPICNPADPLTTADQLAFHKHSRATKRPLAPSLTDQGAARFKFLHTCFGGAITANNVGDFIKVYPEFAEAAKLPKALLHPSGARQLPPCHCCTRTQMRKENAPPASTKQPAPLEEVHLDLFTYPDDPRYDAFFIDRRTRACWHYVLSKKSDLPSIVQQFVVDVNTLNYPVGSIYFSIESKSKYGIDAKAVNEYLSARDRPQRLRILYTDGAGESASDGFEEFLADLNIQHHQSIPESQHQNALAEHGGGWRLVNMVRHDLDISGLGPSFRRFCSSLNAQRMNYLPHSALNGCTPASLLYPDRSLPFKYFLPFGCKATVLKGAAARKANKLDPRGRDGVYIGTAAPYGMQGFLVYVFPESGKGYGTVVVATHAKFDLSFFPARRHDKRVKDFFSTVPHRIEERSVLEDLIDQDGTLELKIDEQGASDDGIIAELAADFDGATTPNDHQPRASINNVATTSQIVEGIIDGTIPSAPLSDQPEMKATLPLQPSLQHPFLDATDANRREREEDDKLQWLDAVAWDIDQEYAAKLDGIIDMHVRDVNPEEAVFPVNPELHQPEPECASDSDDEEDHAITGVKRRTTTAREFAEIEACARNQEDTGRRLRSGTVTARSSTIYPVEYRNFIKDLICDATPSDLGDLSEQAQTAKDFAHTLTEREKRYERAFHASAGTDSVAAAMHAKQAISYIREQRKRRQRYVTDIQTGELIDVTTDGYYDLGVNDLTPDRRIETASFVRLLKKALKTAIREHPEHKQTLAPDLKLLSTPKSAKEALASPQWREWRDAIDKELSSLIQKGVYEVRKIPPGTKAIPTKLVLRIKLKSGGTVEKYKARCVALGFLQRAGLHYHPDECYSPMSDPSTTRALVAVSNALNLSLDHLDVSVAYLNGVLPENQRFFCLPPPGFEEQPGYGWYMLKGLYGTRQGGALWAKTFRDWMRREQPQFVEAGNERVCYVFRESQSGEPINLDQLRGITLEPDEKLIILCMNTDDMLISYTESARPLVDEFERSLNASYAATPRTPLEFYLGMHVQRDREKRVLSIDVRRHIYDFIRSMGLDPFSSASVSTPLDPHVTYSKDDCPSAINTEIKERVLRAHGKLIHMAIWARPDLAHCVSVLGRYIHNPSQKHLDAYIRVARYLIKTKDLRIVYGTHDKHGLVLYGFSDSDWGADPDTYKSTGAYIFFLDGAACSWKVKLSSTALLSSQESEYVAGSEAAKEALNLRMLLEHLGFGDPRPTDIYVDNKGAITMGLHPANKPATRHVNMRMHMLRHHVELGHVSTPYCSTFDMVADYMTKATPKPTHERHNARAMGDQSLAPPLTTIQHLID